MFLQRMKKGVFLLVFFIVASCSEYQKVLKSDDIGLKYSTAVALYEKAEAGEGNVKRNYKRANRIFEQIVPEYRGKPQAQKLMFLYADTFYELKNYLSSGYQFERFAETYPESEKLQEALFKSAKSYYHLSPEYNLDQTDTHKAIEKLQAFINRFPESENLDEANDLVTQLRVKLEEKAYSIAKGYHRRLDYIAAMAAFDNFIERYPGSPFTEMALFYKFDSAYKYAMNSYRYAMEERLATAEEYYEEYVEDFPEGEFMKEATASLTEINKKQKTF